jgi:hypothetical protein
MEFEEALQVSALLDQVQIPVQPTDSLLHRREVLHSLAEVLKP